MSGPPEDGGDQPYRPPVTPDPPQPEADLGAAASAPMPLALGIALAFLSLTIVADLLFAVLMVPACGAEIAQRWILWGLASLVVEVLLLVGVGRHWRRVRWHLPLWFLARELPGILPVDHCMPMGSTVSTFLWVFPGLRLGAFLYIGLSWGLALWLLFDRGVAAWFGRR